MSWNRTVTCSHCYNSGHNRRSCPSLREYVKENPDSWTARRHKESQAKSKTRQCGYCKESGHNRRKCAALLRDKRNAAVVNADFCNKVKDYLEETGLGIGALVTVGESGSSAWLGMVSGFHWQRANFSQAVDSFNGEFVQVRRVATGREGCFRLSEDCEAFPATHYERILDVASPIDRASVRSQISSDWAGGTVGIYSLFDEEVRSYGPSRLISEYAEQNNVEIEKD